MEPIAHAPPQPSKRRVKPLIDTSLSGSKHGDAEAPPKPDDKPEPAPEPAIHDDLDIVTSPALKTAVQVREDVLVVSAVQLFGMDEKTEPSKLALSVKSDAEPYKPAPSAKSDAELSALQQATGNGSVVRQGQPTFPLPEETPFLLTNLSGDLAKYQSGILRVNEPMQEEPIAADEAKPPQ